VTTDQPAPYPTDLTSAVELASRTYWETSVRRPWDGLSPIEQHSIREAMTPVVVALEPLLATDGPVDEVHYYVSTDGLRWRRSAQGNHEPLAHAGEAFTTVAALLANARRVNARPYRATFDAGVLEVLANQHRDQP
jgi:hypothetical protein